jgi:Zn-dependent protease
VLLGVFNLIPIPPLDGSGVVISVFGGAVARAYLAIAPLGFLILILLLWSGILSRVLGPFIRVVYSVIFGGIA